jgi:hypothetical protein
MSPSEPPDGYGADLLHTLVGWAALVAAAGWLA